MKRIHKGRHIEIYNHNGQEFSLIDSRLLPSHGDFLDIPEELHNVWTAVMDRENRNPYRLDTMDSDGVIKELGVFPSEKDALNHLKSYIEKEGI